MTPLSEIDELEHSNPDEAIKHVLRNTSATLEGICHEDIHKAIEDAILKMSWAVLMLRRIQRKLCH